METCLPDLNVITIQPFVNDGELEDEDLARLLSASRRGWRSVKIMGHFYFGERSWEALSRHTSTLENFRMLNVYLQENTALKPFLTSFPRLRSLATNGARGLLNSIGAKEWIHQDPLSGSLTPWLCDYSLRKLSIKILGIPRPDVTHDHYGRMIQRLVYERLSRFVNLEELRLGSYAICFAEEYRRDSV